MTLLNTVALVLLVLLCVSLASYLRRARSRSLGFHWRGDRRRDSRKEWARFRDFLSQHGLALHSYPEYHNAPRIPIPSAPSPFHPQDCEDFVFRIRSYSCPGRTGRGSWRNPTAVTHLALDSSGREVIIKAVPPGSFEAQILERLATSPLRDHPENHTIPVVSILRGDHATFLVQARWGDRIATQEPSPLSFWAGKQAYQLLQGLTFMHEHGIAHGDIYPMNIVCNFTALRTGRPCQFFEEFKTSASYRLAFIDFGESTQLDGIGPHRISCPGRRRGPPSEFRAPELDDDRFFDPFSADVFSLGRLLLDLDPPVEIPVAYQTLLDDMTRRNPRDRPTARVAFERLQALNENHKKHWV
ncbi:kinase-like domain-containing protein [Mycena belliarum]|uniref:Kinase-like domain-containing protein n=1 Tax=Mycena belliarum TaxID=1033014 RepID=A0AAD6XM33_9AGAR|nr:kinase-like domain-containing protein [Mycena belliae]